MPGLLASFFDFTLCLPFMPARIPSSSRDGQFSSLLPSSPAMRNANSELGGVWKALSRELSGPLLRELLHSQRSWIRHGRRKAAQQYMCRGYSAATAYAMATDERIDTIRSFFANVFYKFFNHISDVRLVPSARDYRLMTRRMADAILSLSEYNRFSKGMFEWVGFHTEWISYDNIERSAGKTKFSFWKLFKYSVECIVAFSTAPLQIASVLGFLSTLGAFAYMTFVFVKWLCCGDPVGGWPTLICVVLLLGGLQLFVIGILGLYVAGIFRETKRRPVYVVKESK